jgi:hypothetical protein
MEQNKGVKKETRRHYVGYFRDGECHVERLECVEVYEYDSDGYEFRHKSENYEDNGELSYGTITNRRYEKGEYIFETHNLDGKYLGYDKYDSKWHLVESRFNQMQSWSYNSDGKVVEAFIEFSNGWWKTQYEYNSEGRVVRSVRVNDKSDILIVHHYYSRDCMGNIVENLITEQGELLECNVIDRLSNKVIVNRDERIEVEWNAILRTFKNDIQVSCSSWHSDDIVKSTNIRYLGSWSDDWNISVQPLLHDDESEQEGNGQKCWITIRDLEYSAFDDCMLDEFVDF